MLLIGKSRKRGSECAVDGEESIQTWRKAHVKNDNTDNGCVLCERHYSFHHRIITH